MHNAAFGQSGHNGVYVALHVTDLPGAINGIRALNIHGCSVTIPHKVAVMEYLDQVDPMARQIGAVNTIVNQDGRLGGFNSDGAGGASRALAHGITTHGGQLTIVNRSPDKGERLAAELDCNFSPLSDFTGGGFDILINTTSVGMAPHADQMPVSGACLRPAITVMDIVYNPLETRLIRAARDAGCTVVDGVAMFVHQGAFQFERWTGKKAPIALMKKTVLEALDANAPGEDRPHD